MLAARRLRDPRERALAGLTLVEGPRAVATALDCAAVPRAVFVTDRFVAAHPDLVTAVADRGGTVVAVSESVLDALAQTRAPQGVVATVEIPAYRLETVLGRGPELVAVLVECADPGNVGTVVRSADAAGADAVVLTVGCADPWSAKAVRASVGTGFAVPVVTGVPVDRLVPRLHRAGLTVLAAAGDGSADLDDLADQGGLAGPVAWLFGNEAHGLPRPLLDAADRTVRIAMRGRGGSLNLAAAAAICLHASARSRRLTGDHG